MYANSPSIAFYISVYPGMLSKNILMTARSTSVTLTEKMLLWHFSLWYSHFEIHVPETSSQNLLLIYGEKKNQKNNTFRRIFKLWAMKVGKSSWGKRLQNIQCYQIHCHMCLNGLKGYQAHVCSGHCLGYSSRGIVLTFTNSSGESYYEDAGIFFFFT